MRHRTRALLAVSAAISLFASTHAHATALSDFTRGGALYLQGASITVEGNPYSVIGVPIGKAEGSLDATLSARALGMDLDQIVQLHGTASGDIVTWTFNASLTTPQGIGGGANITSIEGTLIGHIARRAGTHPRECGGPCAFSVDVTEMPGSTLTVHGRAPIDPFNIFWTDFTKTYTDLHFQIVGGMPQPQLTSVTMDVPNGRLCASSSSRWIAGRVQLSDVAPVGGAPIDIASSDTVHFPPFAAFATPGTQTTDFRILVPGNYTGSVNIGAAAGGVMQMTRLDVALCTPPVGALYYVDDRLRGAFTCDACVSAMTTNDGGTVAVHYKSGWWLASPSQPAISLDETVGSTVDDVLANRFDDVLVHSHDLKNVPLVTRVVSPFGKPMLEPISAFEPHAIDARGNALGVCESKNDRLGCVETFGAFTILDSGLSTIDLMSGTLAGDAVGTTATPDGLRAFRFVAGKTETLGTLKGETHAVAINEAGWTAGWSVAGDGKRYAVVFAPGSTKPITLSTPTGWGSAPVGITDDGVVVGNFESGASKVPVVWSTDDGSFTLFAKVTPKAVAPTELLSVTRFGRIVASATRNKTKTVVVFDRKQW